MKKRVLFVDDQDLVLQGLRRMLRGLREEWEMDFVEDAGKALEMMEKEPYDVVVSDMRMPRMNGAQLLDQVMVRHPNTVRIILSGHADHELILQCVGCTHQFLAKPCDADALKATISRATRLGTSVDAGDLRNLVGSMNRLPSVPSIYTEIMEALQNPDTSLDEVGAIIQRDIGMTVTILKLVNSAFFGIRRELSSPAEAASYLGLDIIKALVLSIHAFDQYDPSRLKGLNLEQMWNHSLETASRARRIAKAEGGDRKILDDCFVAGMLHDLGKLILAYNFTEKYAESRRRAVVESLTELEAERRVFGATHPDVAGYLLGLWGLPATVVDAIALHHQPGLYDAPGFSAVVAVYAANLFCHESAKPEERSADKEIDREFLSRLGLDDRIPGWREASQPQVTT